MPDENSLKIRKKIFTSWGQGLLSFINSILTFFNLRQTERFWGIVYDSATKQPIDPVVVKLVYTDGREIETCVTDIGGKYGFLASEGKFKILAHRTNYSFPSKYDAGKADVIYENPYRGEFFVLRNNSEVVAPNIPMDPVGFDWNQKAKQQIITAHPYRILFLRRFMAVLFWFGFIFLLISLWHYYPGVPKYLVGILGFYVFMLFSAALLPEPRLWGDIKFSKDEVDVERLLLEVYSLQFPDIRFGKAAVHADGRFLLRANKGDFLLTVTIIELNGEKSFLAKIPVKVGSGGVVNSSFVIKN